MPAWKIVGTKEVDWSAEIRIGFVGYSLFQLHPSQSDGSYQSEKKLKPKFDTCILMQRHWQRALRKERKLYLI